MAQTGQWDGASLAFSNLQKWKWLNFWCNWEGQGTLFVLLCTVKLRKNRFKTPYMRAHLKPVIQLLSHDCIHKNCSESGQAVNEGAKSSSPAKSKLGTQLWDTREQQTACSPSVIPCGQGTEEDSARPLSTWSSTLLQSFTSTENYPRNTYSLVCQWWKHNLFLYFV